MPNAARRYQRWAARSSPARQRPNSSLRSPRIVRLTVPGGSALRSKDSQLFGGSISWPPSPLPPLTSASAELEHVFQAVGEVPQRLLMLAQRVQARVRQGEGP